MAKLTENGTEEVFVSDAHNLHIDDAGTVWLDTDVGENDGLCIGVGHDRQSALEDARAALIDAVQAVDRELAKKAKKR